jgi:hypothetical protein
MMMMMSREGREVDDELGRKSQEEKRQEISEVALRLVCHTNPPEQRHHHQRRACSLCNVRILTHTSGGKNCVYEIRLSPSHKPVHNFVANPFFFQRRWETRESCDQLTLTLAPNHTYR